MKISGKLRSNLVLDILIFIYLLEDGAVVQECSESIFVKFVSPAFLSAGFWAGVVAGVLLHWGLLWQEVEENFIDMSWGQQRTVDQAGAAKSI